MMCTHIRCVFNDVHPKFLPPRIKPQARASSAHRPSPGMGAAALSAGSGIHRASLDAHSRRELVSSWVPK